MFICLGTPAYGRIRWSHTYQNVTYQWGEKQVDTYDRSVIKRDTRNEMVIQDMHAKSKSLCLFGVLFKISDDTPVLFIWQWPRDACTNAILTIYRTDLKELSEELSCYGLFAFVNKLKDLKLKPRKRNFSSKKRSKTVLPWYTIVCKLLTIFYTDCLQNHCIHSQVKGEKYLFSQQVFDKFGNSRTYAICWSLHPQH